MKKKNTVSVTQARKEIFAITQEVQNANNHYTLTERGVPKAVILSVAKFEKMLAGQQGQLILADGNRGGYGEPFAKFPGTLIIRDESRVVYLSVKDQERKTKEASLAKAQLYIELIEKYGYPIELIELGRYVRVGKKESRHYIEADVIVNNRSGGVEAVFEVSFFGDYEENLDAVVEDLFELGDALSWSKKPKRLVYFSRRFVNQQVQEKILVIDFLKFNSFSAWKKAGRPGANQISKYDVAE
ncbi:MAG: type II toxin-antitoxin system prevent-host-death family antitoxin [Candidatus Moraniibacteriota bacterium]